MRHIHWSIALALGGVLASGQPLRAQDLYDEPLKPASSTRTSQSDASLIDALRKAPDPSSAVAAYARGADAKIDSIALDEAYVRRMIELGVPEMAFVQAQSVTRKNAHAGLAWAVIAAVNARRGETTQALQDLVRAYEEVPKERFVAQVAGQLLAWYDAEGDQNPIPSSLKYRLHQDESDVVGVG